ncbi:hypothetical protein IJI72_00285 [Candidatus Saccharibacteria bacterium]|nr:hypothetical protein [Candidatus Saccharibacteria bacterium]
MKNVHQQFTRLKSAGLALALALSSLGALFPKPTYAAESFGVSPTYQLVTLTPGETFESNFQIVNPAGNTYDFYYELSVEPFTENGNQEIKAVANGDYNKIVDWVELPVTEGVVSPNSSEEIRFKIHVPEDAPAGGQYASIVIGSKEDSAAEEGMNIHEIFQQNHLIYAEVSGETVRKGKIDNVRVPSFLFSGNITGTAEITNEGNVHSPATYTLQVFPFFSKEELYTNVEEPKTLWIMPGNTSYTTLAWDETPRLGVFHVIYNVEYEGVENTVNKFVIVCPIWLLLVILAALFLIFFSIIFSKKKSQK